MGSANAGGLLYYAFDGCSTNSGNFGGIYAGIPAGYYDGTLEAAEIVCCTLEGDSCSRKAEGGDCRSGNHQDAKVTWNVARANCEEAGMRLCNSQGELDQCCATGCGYDNALVWSSLKEDPSTPAPVPTNTAQDLVSFIGVCRYGSDDYDYIESETTGKSVSHCQQSCKKTNGCTAFAYTPSDGWCAKYRGGPYTSGDGDSSYGKCYVMPSLFESCTDTDNGKKDRTGDGCISYKAKWCGKYDDNDFVSTSMCCICGGGITEGTPDNQGTCIDVLDTDECKVLKQKGLCESTNELPKLCANTCGICDTTS